MIQLDEIQLERDLAFMEKPAWIVDRNVCMLRSKETPMLKVIWKTQHVEAATWETEAIMKDRYPELVENYQASKFFLP